MTLRLRMSCRLTWALQNDGVPSRPGGLAHSGTSIRTVWIVTVRDGVLHLVTRIVVGLVTDQAGAEKHLGYTPGGLWKASHHIIASPGTELPRYYLNIHRLAASLRFKSKKGNDRLTLTADGMVNAQQLQRMRTLWPEAAEMLAKELGISA